MLWNSTSLLEVKHQMINAMNKYSYLDHLNSHLTEWSYDDCTSVCGSESDDLSTYYSKKHHSFTFICGDCCKQKNVFVE